MQKAACLISINCIPIAHAEWKPWAQLSSMAAPMVFRVQLADYAKVMGYLKGCVRADEQQRADAYYHAKHAERFLFGRATLRLLLGSLLGKPAATIELAANQAGKLHCANTAAWHLSISYDDAWLVLAIARVEVGLDIEKIKPEFSYDDVAASCFSPAEQQYVAAAKDPTTAFFQLWTRKEAMAKALGTGIDDYFSGLPVLDGAHTMLRAEQHQHTNWVLSSFMLDTQYLVALAYPTANAKVDPSFYHMHPSWYQAASQQSQTMLRSDGPTV